MREILAETGLSTQAFYRYFSSKDELMLALLDEGRRRLVDALERRMARATDPSGRIRAWIEGVLAQAANAAAAARTRPWVLSEPRLAELFPEEEPVAALSGGGRELPEGPRASATLVYQVTFAILRAHLVAGTKPDELEREAVIGFCLRGVTP
jgi:AcrR family transcriptional regulator